MSFQSNKFLTLSSDLKNLNKLDKFQSLDFIEKTNRLLSEEWNNHRSTRKCNRKVLALKLAIYFIGKFFPNIEVKRSKELDVTDENETRAF